ncbi:MAG: diguanylate cyclase [Gammaproteobacteria bacterium]|nr:diguanylate cyclase [Gammaproteobacteria bacterium]
MQQQKHSFSPIQLVFRDDAVERRFLNQYRVKQLDRLQVGFGFLVLFFMAVAAAQLAFFNASLFANLSYAGLGVLALIGFSLLHPRHVIRRPPWLRWILAIGISLGAVAATYIPSISVALQLTAAAVTLMWLSLFSGLSFRQVGILLLGVLLPAITLLAVMTWPLTATRLAMLTALGLATIFACLSSYLSERSARIDYQQLLQSAGSGHRASTAIKQDQGLKILKELTIELSGLRDSDAANSKLLSIIKRLIYFDLAAIGRLQNERMLPVLVRSNSSEAGCEDTIQLLWHSSLIKQLEKQKTPLSGSADMGLLRSVVENGEISFGYRLDIPFFSQRKLDGVVTLLRSTPNFSDSESALAASMVFHGLFARRSARLYQQLEQIQARPAKPTIVSANTIGKQILSVDEFLERATSAFQQAESDGKPVSLILIEMDRHEYYLKRFGQQGVARIFEAMSSTLSENLPVAGLLGRYGSGSFALQLPASLDQARQLADKLRQAIGKHHLTIGKERVSLTVSVGVSARDESSPDFLSLLRGADIGLYLARGEKSSSARFDH